MGSVVALRKGIDWDKARAILDKLAGKKPETGKLKAMFRSRGVYGDEIVAEMEDDLVRSIVRRLNKEAKSEGRPEDQYFNYVEVLDDGTKKQYYDRFSEASPERNAWLVQCEFRKGARQYRKAYELHDLAVEKHGREYEQIMMGFMRTVPDRPSDIDCGLDEE